MKQEQEIIDIDFKLKDECTKCGNKIECNYQETDFTRFVLNNVRFIRDNGYPKYNGVFKIKGKVIKKGGKYFAVCSKCQDL